MTPHSARVVARVELLLEIEAIGEHLALLSLRFGSRAEIEAAWQRQHRARAVVLEQLRALLESAGEVATVQ